MAKKILVDLDLAKNSINNARLQNLAADPSSPVLGQTYFNTSTNKIRTYNGSTWDEYGTSTATGDVSQASNSGGAGRIKVSAGATKVITDYATAGIVKSDASGVASAAVEGTDYWKPGGTDVAVADGGTGASTAANARTNLGLVIGTDVLAPGGSGAALTGITESQVTNLATDLAAKAPTASPTFTGTVTVPTPTGTTDAANKGYVDNAVQGLSWKQNVRAASTANLTLSGAQTIDGVAVVAGERVMAKDQSTGSQNGIYVVAAGAWTRATDTDSSAELVNATAYVSEGTVNADTVWTITNNATITVGTTALVFAQVNGGAVPTASTSTAGKVQLATQAEAQAKTDSAKALTAASVADFARKYTGLIGDGTTTALAVTHGLGSQYVTAQVFDATSNVQVEPDVTLTSSTVTTFTFATAPTSNQYRVVIVG